MEREGCSIQMEMLMKESGWIVKQMVLGFTLIEMELFMKDTGKTIIKMVRV